MGLWNNIVLPRIIECACGTSDIAEIRERVCAGLHGDVIEVGFGSGHNLKFLTTAITTLHVVEPSTQLLAIARERIEKSNLNIKIIGSDGHALPIADASMDGALTTFSMCSIPDFHLALKEIHRVLKPGAAYHFAEHGRAPDPRVFLAQRLIEPVNRRIAGGCHVTRDIAEAITNAGFGLEEVKASYGKGPKTHSFIYEGVARKR